jgi:ComF family protein
MGISMGKKMFGSEKYDLIIPVPLHKGRMRERGYNQSYLISEGLSRVLNIPVKAGILIRSRYTDSQTTLSREGRIENVSGAFEIKSKHIPEIEGRRILLLDDVITTGSTTESCAKTLKENGAKTVTAVSLGIAERKIHLI